MAPWLPPLAVSAFAGGAVGFIETAVAHGLPSSLQQWELTAVGALAAGLLGVYQRYQKVPPAPGAKS